MKIKLPQKLRIGGFDYTIEIADKELESKKVLGDVSHYLKRIRLRSDVSDQELLNDFLHEVLHSIDYVFNDDRTEEGTITVLANGLHQVLSQLGIEVNI